MTLMVGRMATGRQTWFGAVAESLHLIVKLEAGQERDETWYGLLKSSHTPFPTRLPLLILNSLPTEDQTIKCECVYEAILM